MSKFNERFAKIRKKANYISKLEEALKNVITDAANEIGYNENIDDIFEQIKMNFKEEKGFDLNEILNDFNETLKTWKKNTQNNYM